MCEDEPGISAEERFKIRLRMRLRLLDTCMCNFAEFPPPGAHINGMSTVMFEGYLTNIDRRIQLHSLVQGNAYNVRSPTSLDSFLGVSRT